MRRRYKADANEKGIVAALRDIPHCSVMTGVDDILVGFGGLNYLFEIKNPDEVKNDGTLRTQNNATSKKQKKLAETWNGHYQIVWKIEQILEAIGVQDY